MERKINFFDWLQLPSLWAKQAINFTKIEKQAQTEDPPGYNTLLYGILQSVVSKQREYIDKAEVLVQSHVPESVLLGLTGKALYDIGFEKEGIQRIEKLVEIDPSRDNVLGLADLLTKPEEMAYRIDLCTSLLKKEPSDFGALVSLARAYLTLEQLDKASEYIEKALSLDPRSKFAKGMHAEIFYRKGELKRALQEFQNAKTFFTPSSFIYFRLAEIYDILGYKRKANAAKKTLDLIRQRKIDGTLDEKAATAFLGGKPGTVTYFV